MHGPTSIVRGASFDLAQGGYRRARPRPSKDPGPVRSILRISTGSVLSSAILLAMSERPLILLSNDDGVHARGLRALREALALIAHVVTVAPTDEQSAGSHSLTLSRPLRHRTIDEDVHAIDGTPADCIYVALYRERFLPRWPDLVVSGINHGFNLGTDTFYSGTVAAAREGALRGIPAIAFSLGGGGTFTEAAKVAVVLCARMLDTPGIRDGDRGVLLNVNFPAATPYRGVRATRLGRRVYHDEVTVRTDPRGKEYYWIGGPGAHPHEHIEGSDTEAVDQGLVSVTPLLLDATQPDDLGLAAWVANARLGEGQEDEGR
jgi:5'-nucleotidase